MNGKLISLLLIPFFAFAQNGINTPLKAFPDAYGGGAEATGGRGGVLAIINTLDIDAPLVYHPASGGDDEYYTGGWKEAMMQPDVGYIVWNVSGTHNLPIGNAGTGQSNNGGTPAMSGIVKDGGGWNNIQNKTLFGQSAPQGGITFTGGVIRIGAYNQSGLPSNLIFRFLRSRPFYNRDGNLNYGVDDAYTWGFLFVGGNDIILDHCSSSFGYDKAIGSFIREEHVTGTGCPCTLDGHTYSNNLIGNSATGAYTEINPGRAGSPEQYVDQISYFRNVFVTVNRTPNMAFDGYGELYNNIIHNTISKSSRVYHNIDLNFIGNYYQRPGGVYAWIGPNDSGTDTPQVFSDRIFYPGNVSTSDGGGYTGPTLEYTGHVGDGVGIWLNQARNALADPSSISATKFTEPHPHTYTVLDPNVAFTELVTNEDVGANKYLDDNGDVQIYLDDYDDTLLNAVQTNSAYSNTAPANWVMPTIPNNTRPASYDTDNDGMADAWEIRVYGDLSQSYRGDFDADGYENIEEYMMQVDVGNSSPPEETDPSPIKKGGNRIQGVGGSLKLIIGN